MTDDMTTNNAVSQNHHKCNKITPRKKILQISIQTDRFSFIISITDQMDLILERILMISMVLLSERRHNKYRVQLTLPRLVISSP
jgi:hypothetical protein